MRHNCYGFAGALEAHDQQALADAMRSIEIKKRGANLIFSSRINSEAYDCVDKLISAIREEGTAIDERVKDAIVRITPPEEAVDPLTALGYSPAKSPGADKVVKSEKTPEDLYDAFMKRTTNENQ